MTLAFLIPRGPSPQPASPTASTRDAPPTWYAYQVAAGRSDQALDDLLDLHARTLLLREEPITLASLLK